MIASIFFIFAGSTGLPAPGEPKLEVDWGGENGLSDKVKVAANKVEPRTSQNALAKPPRPNHCFTFYTPPCDQSKEKPRRARRARRMDLDELSHRVIGSDSSCSLSLVVASPRWARRVLRGCSIRTQTQSCVGFFNTDDVSEEPFGQACHLP